MEKALKKSSAEAPTSALQTGEPKRRGVKDALEWVMHLIFMLCGIIAVAFVLFISIYLIISGGARHPRDRFGRLPLWAGVVPHGL